MCVCACVSVDVAEVEASPMSQLCTACRQKLDASKPDSVFQHSLLNVLLCKVYKLLLHFVFDDLLLVWFDYCCLFFQCQ